MKSIKPQVIFSRKKLLYPHRLGGDILFYILSFCFKCVKLKLINFDFFRGEINEKISLLSFSIFYDAMLRLPKKR